VGVEHHALLVDLGETRGTTGSEKVLTRSP